MKRPGLLFAWILIAALILIGVATGNWFAGFGPALVVGAVLAVNRWKRYATRR